MRYTGGAQVEDTAEDEGGVQVDGGAKGEAGFAQGDDGAQEACSDRLCGKDQRNTNTHASPAARSPKP